LLFFLAIWRGECNLNKPSCLQVKMRPRWLDHNYIIMHGICIKKENQWAVESKKGRFNSLISSILRNKRTSSKLHAMRALSSLLHWRDGATLSISVMHAFYILRNYSHALATSITETFFFSFVSPTWMHLPRFSVFPAIIASPRACLKVTIYLVLSKLDSLWLEVKSLFQKCVCGFLKYFLI
jgi:hypothetical protein